METQELELKKYRATAVMACFKFSYYVFSESLHQARILALTQLDNLKNKKKYRYKLLSVEECETIETPKTTDCTQSGFLGVHAQRA